MDHHHGFKAVLPVIRQLTFNVRGGSASAPIAGNVLNIQSMLLRNLLPERRKMSGLNISTRSPALRVFTMAASQAPVPEAGKITTGPRVWKIVLSPWSTSLAYRRTRVHDDQELDDPWRAARNQERWLDQESESDGQCAPWVNSNRHA